mgnify:CR=1 FL=1
MSKFLSENQLSWFQQIFLERFGVKFIFENNFEYIVLKNLDTDVLKTINKYNNNKLILWKELNLPILMNYKNQKMNYQVCNENSCRLSSNDFNELFQE